MNYRNIATRLREIESAIVLANGYSPTVSLTAQPAMAQGYEAPIISNLPRATRRTLQSSGLYQANSTWQITAYIARVGEGLTTLQEDAAYDLADKLTQAFDDAPRLEHPLTRAGLQYVTGATLNESTGLLAPLNLPSQASPQIAWWGWRWQLAVTLLLPSC